LILDRLEILLKYRGGGVGLLVLTALIERFGACAVGDQIDGMEKVLSELELPASERQKNRGGQPSQ